jgi:hypothetical protein
MACTEEFRTVTITIVDQSNQTDVLDSFKTIVKKTEVSFTNEDSFSGDSVYRILDDSQKYYTSFEGENFLFEGMKDGQIVVSAAFVIKKDCCHINYVSSNNQVTI